VIFGQYHGSYGLQAQAQSVGELSALIFPSQAAVNGSPMNEGMI